MSGTEDRARLYARAESHRLGMELASGPHRSDTEYRLIFEEMLASAFRIGYAAGEDDARFRHGARTVPHASRK